MSRGENELQAEFQRVVEQYGPFENCFPLTGGLWTNEHHLPQTRLRRVVQCAGDHVGMPWKECRVLDLGCMDGLYSIEFGRQGCEVVGIEGREDHASKARFAARILGLDRVTFLQADVRTKLKEDLGFFDLSVCSGILYHMDSKAAFELIERLYDITRRVVLIDTHVTLNGATKVNYKGREYFGEARRSYHPRWSYSDEPRFFLTRPTLVNFLQDVGFTSVYECFNPPHLNYGRPGIEHHDRCTFVALKSERVVIEASPAVNQLVERWPEGALSYHPATVSPFARFKARLRSLLALVPRGRPMR